MYRSIKTILRRLRKYGWIIPIIAGVAALLFYIYANKKAQYYTASVVIEYKNSEDGKNPDGTDIDTSEIKNSYITGKALKSLGIDNINADVVSNQITIDPIITDEEQALYESKLEHGEDYTIMTNQYKITLSASTTYGADYTKNMLNQILEEYMQYYGEKYIDTLGTTDNLDDVLNSGYDYIEIMDLIEDSLSLSIETLNSKISSDDTFRSSTTNMSFSDLVNEFNFYYSKASSITAQIINDQITKDRDVLLAKYEKKNTDMDLETSSNEKKISDIKDIIDSYVSMMEDSGNASFADEDILESVYDEYDKNYSNEKHTTSYDELMEDYVASRIGCEKNDIETAYNEYIIEKFTNANEQSSDEVQENITSQISALLEKVDTLFDDFSKTNADYNKYLGVQHIKPLSSVCIQKKLPVKKYTILIACAVFVFGCIFFLIISRLYDIFSAAISAEKEKEKKLAEKKDTETKI